MAKEHSIIILFTLIFLCKDLLGQDLIPAEKSFDASSLSVALSTVICLLISVALYLFESKDCGNDVESAKKTLKVTSGNMAKSTSLCYEEVVNMTGVGVILAILNNCGNKSVFSMGYDHIAMSFMFMIVTATIALCSAKSLEFNTSQYLAGGLFILDTLVSFYSTFNDEHWLFLADYGVLYQLLLLVQVCGFYSEIRKSSASSVHAANMVVFSAALAINLPILMVDCFLLRIPILSSEIPSFTMMCGIVPFIALTQLQLTYFLNCVDILVVPFLLVASTSLALSLSDDSFQSSTPLQFLAAISILGAYIYVESPKWHTSSLEAYPSSEHSCETAKVDSFSIEATRPTVPPTVSRDRLYSLLMLAVGGYILCSLESSNIFF